MVGATFFSKYRRISCFCSSLYSGTSSGLQSLRRQPLQLQVPVHEAQRRLKRSYGTPYHVATQRSQYERLRTRRKKT